MATLPIGDVGGAADRVDQGEGEGGGRYGEQRGDEGRDGHRTAAARQHLHQAAEEGVGDDGGDERHVGDVHAERGEAAVGEEDALHQQDDGDAEHAGVGADEDRGQRAAEQVSAGAGGDREVQHLHGEDERGDQAGQRRGPFVQFAAGRPAGSTATAPAATTRSTAETGALMNPSGTCMEWLRFRALCMLAGSGTAQ